MEDEEEEEDEGRVMGAQRWQRSWRSIFGADKVVEAGGGGAIGSWGGWDLGLGAKKEETEGWGVGRFRDGSWWIVRTYSGHESMGN